MTHYKNILCYSSLYLFSMTNYKISVCYSSIYLSSMTGKSQREREREETMGCLLHLSSKSYVKYFLFVGSATLGTFSEF